MTQTLAGWRTMGGIPTAWFGASSLTQAAGFAGHVLGLGDGITADVRPTGVRVRLDSASDAPAVSAAAADLGLAADPAVLHHVDVVVESPAPSDILPFWQRVLDRVPSGDRLPDPLQRDPDVRVEYSGDRRPLRGRIHLDVVRPPAEVEKVGLGDGSGPYGVRHADADGNEVDLVPGDALGEGTADWQVVFGAIACYRVTSVAQQVEVARVAASLAEQAGFPLSIDLRAGLVVLDTGKDRWEASTHGLDVDFVELARRVQRAARDLGAEADPALPRFVQLFLDAADVERVRSFWVAALDYVPDRRAGVTDIHDRHRLGPVVVFQELDATDTARRRQRNRTHVELALPADSVPARVAAAVAAGGRVLDDAASRVHIADPEGNELVIAMDTERPVDAQQGGAVGPVE